MNNYYISKLHPFVSFIYFVGIFIFTASLRHPLFAAAGFFASLITLFVIKKKSALKNLYFALPMMVIITVLNMLLNRNGRTALFDFLDNPITLESLVYGAVSAFMICSMLMWFSVFNEVFGSDKIFFLMGKRLPVIAILISMTMNLVPAITKTFKKISAANKLNGSDPSSGKIKTRIKTAASILSAVTTYTLENSVETAVSMKSKGFDDKKQKKRTSYSFYKYNLRSFMQTIFVVIIFAIFITFIAFGMTKFTYFPTFEVHINYLVLILYSFFILIPAFVEILEIIKWRKLKSKASTSHITDSPIH